ncbi:sigma factor-like helix-turn-helix DNA-binding protein [Actinomadura algeriensis]|uniref:DNA-directed RNA polymerase specialized sigma24 family protein n=1 Tax=Actinomadura algeriensis TaxID=1679523 RepID=A0ABR9JQS3_9ACTN|nr:sigma factor-like helix-turn-helix DNA-binding protein [Actinomadura algeriensis]MBE1532917.1 DNA-directed RNA polymerase specialized sigma24 family protein [Actinomadura algeriensis]
MDDRELVETLRAREPDAPASVYGAYADRLYAYCWFRTQARDDAQVALRDTFVAAEAHIDKLRDPELFGPWLYAIARLQCARRPPSMDRTPDPPVASHDQEDVDQRLISWNAVQALSPVSQDVLDLHVRHGLSIPELAAVLGLPPGTVQAALGRAHTELEQTLTAAMLEGQGPYGCAERASLLKERSREADVDGRLLRHAEECPQCEAFRPRTVSASKVFGLLPDVAPPDELRLRVVSCFTDPALVGYRLFVATGLTGFTAAGFPVQGAQPGRTAQAPSARKAWARGVLAAATVVMLGGGGYAWTSFDGDDRGAERVETVVGPKPSPRPRISQGAPLPDGEPGDAPAPVHETSKTPVAGQAPGTGPRSLIEGGPPRSAGSGQSASTGPSGGISHVPAPPHASPSRPTPPSKPPPSGGGSPVPTPPPTPTDEPTPPPATGQSPTPTG